MSHSYNRLRYHDTALSPVALWQGDGDLTDASGNGLTLTVGAGTIRYVNYGQGALRGFSFNGATWLYDATSAAALAINGDVTVCAMINTTAGQGYVVSHGSTSTSPTDAANNDLYDCFVGGVSSANPYLYMLWRNASSNANTLVGTHSVSPGWAHCYWQRTGAVCKLGLNGENVNTSGTLNAASGGGTPYAKVGINGSASSYYTGAVASIAIYNSALTDAQLKGLARHCLGG